VIEARLMAPMADGRSLRAWIDENVPADAVLVGTDAQATGYALHRRAISLTEAEYSDERWGASEVLALMGAYRAELLILYPGGDPARVRAQRDSPFLGALLRRELPPWLVVAAENDRALILRRVE
jgi:hypothetical protein